MKKYLITGGAGFIGSHLCEELLSRGCAVHVVDDLSTGSQSNLDLFRDRSEFSSTIACVTDHDKMRPLVEQSDGVFHLAAAVGVQLVFERPTHTIQTNIRGAETVLELAAAHKKRVFIASTSEVYGKGVRIPLAETDDLLLGPTTCPRWSYACSKAVDEFLALAYWKEQQLPSVIGRFFNTVGPRQTGRYGMVIPRFIDQALAGEPITIYGDGSQTRCFGFVKDIVRGVCDLMECEGAAGQVFNIGANQEISIRELAEKIVAMTGSISELKFIEFEDAYGPEFEDMERRVPNIEKIAGVIEWKNLKTIDEILEETIRWERESS